MLDVYADAKFYLRKRYLMAVLFSFGLVLNNVVKGGLSNVLADITNYKYIVVENTTTLQKPEIDWNSEQIGFAIAAETYGQAPTLFIAGILAKKYGGATTFLCGTLILSIPTFVLPFLIHYHYGLFIAARIIEGVGSALLIGSFADIVLQWAPTEEQGRFVMIHHLGGYGGSILSGVTTGYMIYYFDWKFVFFTAGCAGLLLSVVWFILASNRPEDDTFITNIEKIYLKNKNTQCNDKSMSIFSYPWRQMLTSKPTWAYLNEVFCSSWSSAFIYLCFPLYIKDITKSDARSVALLSVIPYVCPMIVDCITSYVLDRVRANDDWDKSKVYRSILTIGHSGVGLCLVTIALASNFEASVILISVAQSLVGMKVTTYYISGFDVFYRYAAVIQSFGGGIYMVTSGFCSILMGFIITSHEQWQWNLFIGLLVIFNIWSVFIFCCFGSGKIQPWAAVQAEPGDQTRTEEAVQ